MHHKHLRVRRNYSRTLSGGYRVGVLVGGVSVMVTTVLIYGYLTYCSLGLVTVVTAVTTFRRGGLPLSWGTRTSSPLPIVWEKGVPLYFGDGGDGPHVTSPDELLLVRTS